MLKDEELILDGMGPPLIIPQEANVLLAGAPVSKLEDQLPTVAFWTHVALSAERRKLLLGKVEAQQIG